MQKNKAIRVIVVEDQDLMRRSFMALLKEDKSIKVIADVANGKELLEILKQTTPDIVLLDIEMPLMNGKEALEIINKRFPDIKVIMLSMHAGSHFISELMSRGARAFIPKDCNPSSLFQAIHAVHNEGYYFDKTISEAMLRGLQREKSINPILNELSLSEREKEILKEICEGKTNKEIGESLKISASTVDYHRSNLYKKTQSKNITDLLKYAIKNGLVQLL